MLTVIDEVSRECLADPVDCKLNNHDVLHVLGKLFVRYRLRQHIRSDNVHAFVAKAVREDFLDRVRLSALLSLCAVLMQIVTEWEFRQTPLFFLGHITMSVAAYAYYGRRETCKNERSYPRQ